MSTYTVSLCAACLLVIAVGCSRQDSSPMPDVVFGDSDFKATYQDGRAEAQKDIASGKIILKTYGFPAPWSDTYRSNLLSQYQIESRRVAGCSVTKSLVESVKGYNEISEAEIERRYGTGVLQRVAKEVELAWQQRETLK